MYSKPVIQQKGALVEHLNERGKLRYDAWWRPLGDGWVNRKRVRPSSDAPNLFNLLVNGSNISTYNEIVRILINDKSYYISFY
ncbi:hypothetical protein [Metabacillus sediminilitoris]|uniref:Uncharacterized protein n=1 Tax=Metabacillus sediminilitoris TaxID=2567941 RepID=A0A4S4BRL0_9BACI|nr:hypothetical protein [Metabacillus sediminilitoris]QGQ45523.1 hypothetical protein GMB29_09845 [Metabacillus sediminilitoris]THF77620.1 hypothetical protein E6W99_18075 [Metabacillus sediminilitoris]